MPQQQFQTLSALFLQAVETFQKPDAFLVKSAGQYRGISSRESLLKVAALVRAFEKLGVQASDRIALLAENRVEWALTDYAVLALGAITAPLYSTLLDGDVEYVLRDSGAKGVVVSTGEQLQKVLAVKSNCPALVFVVAMDCESAGAEDVLRWKDMAEPETTNVQDSAEFLRARAQAVRPESPASIVYTSGTTGALKGVVLTHSNIVSNIDACSQLFDHGVQDVGMSFLPLAHIFERMLDFHYLSRGVSIAYAENYNSLAQNLREVQPTVMAVVPRVVEKIREKIMEGVQHLPPAKQKLFAWSLRAGQQYFPCKLDGRNAGAVLPLKRAVADKLVFSKIREQLGGRFRMLISGAAPLSRELAEFYFAIGIPVYEGYGLTETSPVIAVNCLNAVKLGTVGRVIPGVEVKLGEESAGAGGPGGREILVRGPNVTPGYYHQDEESRNSFAGEWFRTGDLGTLDSDGYLAITGRKKNLFKTSGGKFVSPEKLENLFQGHPYVAQLMVLGDTRKFVGALMTPNFAALEACAREQRIPFVSREELVASEWTRAFMQEQVDQVCQHLPPHERIRQIVLLPNEFTIATGELSATLKIKRKVVEQRYRHRIEEMFARRPPSETVALTPQ